MTETGTPSSRMTGKTPKARINGRQRFLLPTILDGVSYQAV